MARSLSKRLDQLEQREPKATFRSVVVSGTRAEVEQKCEKMRAEAALGECIIFLVFVPYDGESVNQFREREGLAPLNIAGWDEPRGPEGPL